MWVLRGVEVVGFVVCGSSNRGEAQGYRVKAGYWVERLARQTESQVLQCSHEIEIELDLFLGADWVKSIP